MFTAQTPAYPPEIQELLTAIATASSERVRTALQKEFLEWQREDSLAKQREAERKARMLASGATPEEIADLLKDQENAAKKLAAYIGGVAHSAQIRKDFPPYWMVSVISGEKVVTLGAGETVREMLKSDKARADRYVASHIGSDWVPPTQSLVEAFIGA